MPLVHPYGPDQAVPWHQLDLDVPKMRLCGFAFRDKQIATELRRYAFRDPVQTMVALGYIFLMGFLLVGRGSRGESLVDANGLGTVAAFLISVTCFVVDAWAHFCAPQLKYTTSVVRQVIGVVLGVASALFGVSYVATSITGCGDRDAIFSNNTNVSIPATSERQQYCIDTIDPYYLAVYTVLVPMLRPYPQHCIPMCVLTLVCYGLGYANLPDESEEPYTLRTRTIAASMLINASVCVGAIILNCYLHGGVLRRFLAAARAEQARRAALAELEEVDALLGTLLPDTVLAKVSKGTEVFDESENVTVLYGELIGFASWTASQLEDATVALNDIVTGFDAVLKRTSGVQKVKTIGDVYWAMAGLPEPVNCHASIVCKLALDLHETAVNKVGEYAATSDRHLNTRFGIATGAASGTILGTQRLIYEPFGPAYDDALAITMRTPLFSICMSEATRDALVIESTMVAHEGRGGDVSTESSTVGLFPNAADVHEFVTALQAPLSPVPTEQSMSVGGGSNSAAVPPPPPEAERDENGQYRNIFRLSLSTPVPSDFMSVTDGSTSRPSQLANTRRAQASASANVTGRRRGGDRTSRRTTTPANTHVRMQTSETAAETVALLDDQWNAMTDRVLYILERGAELEARAQRRLRRAKRLGMATNEQPSVVRSTTYLYRKTGSGSMDQAQRARSSAGSIAPTGATGSAAYAVTPHGGGPTSEAGASRATTTNNSTEDLIAANEPVVDDVDAIDRVRRILDSEEGPFARRWPAVPLLHTFKHAAAEAQYLAHTAKMTYEMRRDARATFGITFICMITAILIETTGADGDTDAHGREWAPPYGAVAVLALAAACCVICVVLVVQNRLPAPLEGLPVYGVAFVGCVGTLLADGTVIGNDTTYYTKIVMIYVMMTTHTVSPLVRCVLHSFFGIAAFARLMILDVGARFRNGQQTAVSLFVMGIIVSGLEAFNRRAFVEVRLTEALAAQSKSARDAQRALLDLIVPHHAVPNLVAWMRAGLKPSCTVATAPASAMICVLNLTSFKAPGPALAQHAGQRWLMEAHRVIDALLERCLFIDKIKTCGSTVIFAGGLSNNADGEAARQARHQSAGVVVNAVCDAVFLLKTLTQLGVGLRGALHVGPVTACIVGTLRPSYDVLGPTVAVTRALCVHCNALETANDGATMRNSGGGNSMGLGGSLPAFGVIAGVGEEVPMASAGQRILLTRATVTALAPDAPSPTQLKVAIPMLVVDATSQLEGVVGMDDSYSDARGSNAPQGESTGAHAAVGPNVEGRPLASERSDAVPGCVVFGGGGAFESPPRHIAGGDDSAFDFVSIASIKTDK